MALLTNNVHVPSDSWVERRSATVNATARCGYCHTLWREAFATLAEAQTFLEQHLQACLLGAPQSG